MSFVRGGDILSSVMLGILRLMGQVIPVDVQDPYVIANLRVIANMAARESTPPRLMDDLNGEELYGLFLVLAYEIENAHLGRVAETYLEVAEWSWVPFGNLIENRLNGGEVIPDERLLTLWTPEQITTAANWATKDLNFSRPGSGR